MLSALSPRDPRFWRVPAGTSRRLARVVLVGLLALGAADVAHAQRVSPAEGFGDIVAQITPAVVNISTRKDVATEAQPDSPPMPQFPPGSPFEEFFKDFFERDRSQQEQQPRRSFSLGSGFVIDPTGFVVTNNHVIADADEITVIFNDESEYPAKLIGTDTKTDLALLKIERPDPFPFDLRREGPPRVSRCARCTTRSRMASATVGSPRCSCQRSLGS